MKVSNLNIYTHLGTIFISINYIFRFQYVLGIELFLIPRSLESNKQTKYT